MREPTIESDKLTIESDKLTTDTGKKTKQMRDIGKQQMR